MVEEKKCPKKCDVGIPMDETPKLRVDGKDIGIACLDDVLREVMALCIKDDAAITKELLTRVKDRDYIPSRLELEYGVALLEEYKQRCP